jgi:DNA polymerase III sliding clamp (beta) subunit (PCNA family)
MIIDAQYFYFASKFSATEKSKHSECRSVHFDYVQETDKLTMVATDGKRMVLFRDVSLDNGNPMFSKFSITIKVTKDLVKICKPGKHTKVMEILENGEICVTEQDRCIYKSPESLSLDCFYPEYRRILPNQVSTQENPNLVTSVSLTTSFLEDFSLGEPYVTINFVHDVSGMVVITNDGFPNMLGLLMPCLGLNNLDLDSWQ